MEHHMSSQPNSEDESAESEPGGHGPNSDVEEETENSSSGDSSGSREPVASSRSEYLSDGNSTSDKPSTTGADPHSPFTKPLTPILSSGNKERRQGNITSVSILENVTSPFKKLTIDVASKEAPRVTFQTPLGSTKSKKIGRRTVSEGDGILGLTPNRKPSLLTPDAPEFIPRWMQGCSGDAPMTAPVYDAPPKMNARSRSMVGAFPQPPPYHVIPPHSNQLPGYGRPPPGPFSGGLRMHPFNFPPRHPHDRRISAPAMPYMNHRYPGAVPLYHAVEPLTPVTDSYGQVTNSRTRHSSGGDIPNLGKGPSPIPIPSGTKRIRQESLTDYLPMEPPMFYTPGLPRQTAFGAYYNGRQKLRSTSTPPNHAIGSPTSSGPLSPHNGKPVLQYSREFLLQQRYSPLSWTTPAFVPPSEGGIARRTSSTTDPREPNADKGGALPELACIKRRDELSYDYSVGPRRWEGTSYGKKRNLDEQAKGKGSPKAFRFTFVSYNILAQSGLEENKHLYDWSAPEVLEWDHRKHNLLKEIMHFKADIICLQEVQNKHYEEFFKPNMELQGFKSVYKQRTGDEKTDGCAIFYNVEKFELKKTLPVDYNRGVDILDRDNVALMVMLQPKKDWTGGQDMRLCIATTHLLFNPKRGDIKLAQLAIFLAELDRFTRKGIEQGTGMPLYHPSIVCGDFNAVPYSEIYRLVHRGRLKYENLVAKDISGQQDDDGHGLMRFVAKPLLPKSIGITEQCQYADIATRYVRTRSDTSMTLNSISDAEDLMAHAARAAAEASRKPSSATPNVSPNGNAGTASEGVEVFEDSVRSEESVEEAHEKVDNCVLNSPIEDKSSDIKERSDANDNLALESDGLGDLPASPTSPTVSTSPTSVVTKERSRHESSSSVSSGLGAPQLPLPLGELNHAFRLLSVYKHVEERRGRNLKEVTTHHGRGQSTVDYIFFTVKAMKTECKKGRIIPKNIHEGPLKLMGRYRLLNEEDSENMGWLPNTVYSSDHFALAAKFLLDPN